VAGTKNEDEDRAWMELQSPELGIRIAVPPVLTSTLSYDDDRQGHFLVAGRDDLREFLAIARLAARAGGETAAAWHIEADRLRSQPDWIGAVVAGPYAMPIDGVRGHQGWLRLGDARGQEYLGLLWVGGVADDCVTVAYWCHADGARSFVPRYRRLLDSIRWTRE
jgi:hypothetical protein